MKPYNSVLRLEETSRSTVQGYLGMRIVYRCARPDASGACR